LGDCSDQYPTTGGSNFTLTSDVVGVDLEHGGETTVKKVAAK
jgi:hypothetical protein